MKPNLLLLHGALGAKAQLKPLADLLADQFEVHRLDFSGHGEAVLSREGFDIAGFAGDVLAYLDTHGIDRVDIWGYSMGGYVGLYLARHAPERVGRLCTLATKVHWTPEGAAREVKMLDPDTIEAKVPRFARALEARHTALGWKEVLQHTQAMMIAMGAAPPLQDEDFAQIEHQVRIGLGDRDRMVSLEESRAVYRLLPTSELEVYPATPHPLEQCDLTRLARAIKHFFT